MTTNNKTLKLGTCLIAPRAASGGWRHPLSNTYVEDPLHFFTQVVQVAERGKLDFIFQPDQYSVFSFSDEELAKAINVWLEPITLFSAMAAVSKKIGLCATLSTTYNEPYHVARMFASLDHLSKGRACWNIVMSRGDYEDLNFKSTHRPTIAERDEHATLFVELVKALWDSWEPDAIIADKESGLFAIPEKIHPVQHESKWFALNGPLNVARPPQGYPVLMQAGLSDDFKERAAKSSEVIFTKLTEIKEAKVFYKDVKQRLAKYGRKESDLLIMPGLQVIVGKTKEEALEKQQKILQLERLEIRNDRIAFFIGLDMKNLTLDSPLPEHSNMDEDEKFQRVRKTAEQQGLKTIKELYRYLEEKYNHHLQFVGTSNDIADQMETWLKEEAVDGFIFIPHILPTGLADFVNEVIPVLQKRGIFRKEYEGSTLREHLGLTVPNIYS